MYNVIFVRTCSTVSKNDRIKRLYVVQKWSSLHAREIGDYNRITVHDITSTVLCACD